MIPKPARQTDIAKDFKNILFISKPFRSEVQSHLCVNSSIAGAGAAATATATSKCSSQSQRLTETRRGEVADRRTEIHMVQKVLEVDRDVDGVSLLTRGPTTAALWSSWSNSSDSRAPTAGCSNSRSATRS